MKDKLANPIILLVEDEEDDEFFFTRTFGMANFGFTLRHAINGSAAIEFLRNAADAESLPRLIFLDLKMPVLNGFDVLTWMRNQTFPSPIPVVILSGSEQKNDKQRAQELGAIDYLVKPITIDDFRRVLEEIGTLNPPQAPGTPEHS